MKLDDTTETTHDEPMTKLRTYVTKAVDKKLAANALTRLRMRCCMADLVREFPHAKRTAKLVVAASDKVCNDERKRLQKISTLIGGDTDESDPDPCLGCTRPGATYNHEGFMFCNEGCASCFTVPAGDGWRENELEYAAEEAAVTAEAQDDAEAAASDAQVVAATAALMQANAELEDEADDLISYTPGGANSPLVVRGRNIDDAMPEEWDAASKRSLAIERPDLAPTLEDVTISEEELVICDKFLRGEPRRIVQGAAIVRPVKTLARNLEGIRARPARAPNFQIWPNKASRERDAIVADTLEKAGLAEPCPCSTSGLPGSEGPDPDCPKHGRGTTELERIRARIAYLDEQIASAPGWGAAVGAMDEERQGLLRKVWREPEVRRTWPGDGPSAKQAEHVAYFSEEDATGYVARRAREELWKVATDLERRVALINARRTLHVAPANDGATPLERALPDLTRAELDEGLADLEAAGRIRRKAPGGPESDDRGNES